MPTSTPNIARQILQKYQSLAPKGVIHAVQQASRRTGVDFAYLMEKAAVESSFDTKASAQSSSARGLFQFIDSTWLEMVDKYGDKYGLGRYADAIEKDHRGRFKVANPQLREEIMSLRNDPQVSALLAAEYAARNKQTLAKKVKGPIGATELYFAHFMGANGAADFLNAMHRDDRQIGAELFPKAARANKGVFFDPRTGAARTLREIYAFFDKKFEAMPGGGGTDRGQVMLADAAPIPQSKPKLPVDTHLAFARPASGPKMHDVKVDDVRIQDGIYVRAPAPVSMASAREALSKAASTPMAGNSTDRLAPQLAMVILDQLQENLAKSFVGGADERSRASHAYSAWA